MWLSVGDCENYLGRKNEKDLEPKRKLLLKVNQNKKFPQRNLQTSWT